MSERAFKDVRVLPEYMDTAAAAAMLGLSPRTLERMRVEGTGPEFRKLGPGIRSRVVYRPEDIRSWVEALSFGSTSEYRKEGQ